MTTLECPYPGPMPLRAGQQLFGRDQDLGLLTLIVHQRQLITLTASSGVGKTSLLQAGLIPALEQRNFVVARFSEWGTLEGEDEAERFVSAIRRALGERANPGEDILDALDRWRAIYGDRLVVVFDQFEEIFRQDRGVGTGILAAIADSLTGDVPYPFRFLLSLRTEFRDEITALETVLDPSVYDSYRLEELGPEVAETIIVDSPRTLPAPGVSFDDSAAKFLSEGWREAVTGELAGRDVRAGLLHLQALMWVIWQDLNPQPGSVVGVKDLLQAGVPTAFGTSTRVARDTFADAIEDYADRRLQNFEQALADQGGEPERAHETRYLLSTIVPRLSSGGYKLTWETPDLAAEALPDALADMNISDQLLAEAVCVAETFNAADESQESELMAHLVGWLIERDASLGEPEEIAVSHAAGRLFGAVPARIVAELVVTFRRAISWLEEAYIVRTAHTARNTRMVSLIHDGFGQQLKVWARRVSEESGAAFSSIVSISGVNVFPQVRDGNPGTVFKVSDIGEKRFIVWQGCIVTAELSNLEFIECDFRGTLFLGAHLRRVTFRDCIMWGALFKACTMEDVIIESTADGGFGSSLTKPEGNRLDEVQTLTFGRLGKITGGGLTLRGLKGYGVFKVDVEGGPFTIEDCDLTHVGIKDHSASAESSVRGSSRLRHFDYVGPEGSSPRIEQTVELELSSVGVELNPK